MANGVVFVLLGVLFGLAGAFVQGTIGGKMPTNRQIVKGTGYWSLLVLLVFTASFAVSKTPATKEGLLSWWPLGRWHVRGASRVRRGAFHRQTPVT